MAGWRGGIANPNRGSFQQSISRFDHYGTVRHTYSNSSSGVFTGAVVESNVPNGRNHNVLTLSHTVGGDSLRGVPMVTVSVSRAGDLPYTG